MEAVPLMVCLGPRLCGKAPVRATPANVLYMPYPPPLLFVGLFVGRRWTNLLTTAHTGWRQGGGLGPRASVSDLVPAAFPLPRLSRPWRLEPRPKVEFPSPSDREASRVNSGSIHPGYARLQESGASEKGELTIHPQEDHPRFGHEGDLARGKAHGNEASVELGTNGSKGTGNCNVRPTMGLSLSISVCSGMLMEWVARKRCKSEEEKRGKGGGVGELSGGEG